MSAEDIDQIQAQLDEWRTKLDELRVKGSLLKMEYRDKQDETVEEIEAAYAAAQAKFLELKASGETEAGKLGDGFKAALGAFKKAYAGVTEDKG